MKLDPKFKIEEACSTDERRKTLKYVFYQDGTLTATDGHILACVPVEDGPEDCAMVHPKAISDARKNVMGPTFEPSKAINGPSYPIPEDLQFPDTKRIYPGKERKEFSIGLDPILLLAVSRAIGLNASKYGDHGVKITFEVDDDGKPLPLSVMRVSLLVGNVGTGLIMPCRTEVEK